MTDSAANSILRFATEGTAVKSAVIALDRQGASLSTALRRGIPFLVRRGIPAIPGMARAAPVAEILAELPRPHHYTRLSIMPGGGVGLLVLDAVANAMTLDGTLGGDGKSLPTLPQSDTLTGPQSALVARVATGVVEAFAQVFEQYNGTRITAIADGAEIAADAIPISMVLQFATADYTGKAAIFMPRESLAPRASGKASDRPTGVDPSIVASLSNVEMEVVVELGRLPIRLGQLSALKVGDTLKLDVAVGGVVKVRAGGRELLSGRPTTQGGQIAIRIEDGHDD